MSQESGCQPIDNSQSAIQWRCCMDTVGIGMIGSGYMALTYAESLARHMTGARLVAIAGGRRAPSLAAEYEVDAEESVEALLTRADIDAVILTTPDQVHCAQTLQAAAAGKHVLVEKPMAPTVAQCDQMIAACHAADDLVLSRGSRARDSDQPALVHRPSQRRSVYEHGLTQRRHAAVADRCAAKADLRPGEHIWRWRCAGAERYGPDRLRERNHGPYVDLGRDAAAQSAEQRGTLPGGWRARDRRLRELRVSRPRHRRSLGAAAHASAVRLHQRAEVAHSPGAAHPRSAGVC